MGSGHLDYPARELGLGYVEVSGRFAPNAGSDPTTVKGLGYSVEHTATGVWTITFNQSVNVKDMWITSLHGTFQDSDTDYHKVQGHVLSTSAKTLVIKHFHSADTSTTHPALANIAANADHWIHFAVKFATTSAQGSGL